MQITINLNGDNKPELTIKYIDPTGKRVYNNPCKTCNKKGYKEEYINRADCYNCNLRLLYVESHNDQSLIPQYKIDDEKYMLQLNKNDFKNKSNKPGELSKKTVSILKKASNKNGFGNSWKNFLLHLKDDKNMHFSQMVCILNVSASTAARAYKLIKKEI
jgi:hypothetical protein